MTDVFSGAALYQWSGYRVGEGTQAEGVPAMNVTPSFFQVLGAQPSSGRLFAEADGTPGKNKVVVLSYTFAARQPAGINGIVGSRLRLNGEVYDVVGVLPESFSFLSPEVRVFVPLAFKPEELGEARATARTTSSYCGWRRASRSRAPRRGSTRRTRSTSSGPGQSRPCSSMPATARRSCPSRPISFATCARRSRCSGAASSSLCSSPP